MDNDKENNGDPSQSASSTAYALTASMIEILDHTKNRAARGLYCGGSETMDRLCEMKLMAYAGKTEWCPDKYYRITEAGRAALVSNNLKPRMDIDEHRLEENEESRREAEGSSALFGFLAVDGGEPKKVERLSTFRWRNMECFSHWATGWWGRGIRATHARTGVCLTLVPVFNPKPDEMNSAIECIEEYAKSTLRSEFKKLRDYPSLPND